MYIPPCHLHAVKRPGENGQPKCITRHMIHCIYPLCISTTRCLLVLTHDTFRQDSNTCLTYNGHHSQMVSIRWLLNCSHLYVWHVKNDQCLGQFGLSFNQCILVWVETCLSICLNIKQRCRGSASQKAALNGHGFNLGISYNGYQSKHLYMAELSNCSPSHIVGS